MVLDLLAVIYLGVYDLNVVMDLCTLLVLA